MTQLDDKQMENIEECKNIKNVETRLRMRSGSAATRIANQDGVWRPTLSNIKAAAVHGESETISEKLAYRKFIKDLEFETREVFER